MKRLLRFVATTALILGFVAALGLFWRESIIEAALKSALSSRGLEVARLEVVAVNARELVIEDFALAGEQLTAGEIRLTYEPAELYRGVLRDLAISNLKLNAAGGLDAVLAPLSGRVGGDAEAIFRLRSARLSNAKVLLASPSKGEMKIDGVFDLAADAISASAEVGLKLERGAARFSIQARELAGEGRTEIESEGDIALLDLPVGTSASTTEIGGSAAFSLRGAIGIPEAEIPMTGASVLEWLSVAGVSLGGEVRLVEATTRPGRAVLSGRMDWALSVDENGLRVDLPTSAELALRRMDDEFRSAIGLPEMLGVGEELHVELSSAGPLVAWTPKESARGGVAAFAGEFKLGAGDASTEIRTTAKINHDSEWRMSAPAEVSILATATKTEVSLPIGGALIERLEWSADGQIDQNDSIDLRGSISLRARELDFPLLRVDALATEGEVRVERRSPSDWVVSAAPGLVVELGEATAIKNVNLFGPNRLTADTLRLSVIDGSASVAASVLTDQVRGEVTAGGSDAIPFSEAGGRAEFDLELGERTTGQLRLREGHVNFTGEEIGLESVSAVWPLSADGARSMVSLSGVARDDAHEARFSELRFDVAGAREGDAVSLSGEVATLSGAARASVEAAADLGDATAEFVLGPARLGFKAGSLQPAGLSPRLDLARNAQGAVNVTLEGRTDAQSALQTEARISFDDFSAEIDGVDVLGLSGALRLRGPSLLSTAGPQRLSARRLTVGVPVDSPTIQFSLAAKRGAVSAHVHSATCEIAGGRVLVADARWNSAARSNAVDLKIENVDLDRLLRDWRIEGVSGTGVLSGVIPVKFGSDGGSIEAGRLSSGGAGLIRVDWGSAREFLVGSGEQVALAVNALEDFHYDALEIGVDKPTGGELTLAIGLEGSNPAVLDGYPFRFNVNLSGRIEPILAAIRQGQRIGGDLLQGGLGAR